MSTLHRIGNAIVCREEMVERKRETDGEPRWCFTCRKVRVFEFVITAPVGISYYGPHAGIYCAVCNKNDGDMFPGRERYWEED